MENRSRRTRALSFRNLQAAAIAGVISLAAQGSGFGAFVYRGAGEFTTSGDFNGDGVPDALIVDEATGNARIGYNTNGVLTWSSTIPTGMPGVDAVAVGRFRDANADSIVVASAHFNRLHLARGNPTVSPAVFRPHGVGPNLLAALPAPYGTNSTFDALWIGSGHNTHDPGVTLLELHAFVADSIASYQDSAAQEAYLSSGNALRLGGAATLVAAMRHDETNDAFVVYSPSNHFSQVLSRASLPPGSEYVFGTFNSEALPRFLFFVPGQSNLLIHSVSQQANGTYQFDTGVTVGLSGRVQGVYYVQYGSDGLAVVRFGDGVQGLTVASGSPTLTPVYRSGTGAPGNAFTGVIPLGNGRFAALDAAPGSLSSASSQVLSFNGSTFSQMSASPVSPLTSRSTRPNLWLFQSEPFVSDNALFLASTNAPDWSSGASISGGLLSAKLESDAGPTGGLGNSISNNLGSVPVAAAFVLADQFSDAISLFAYAPPQPAEDMVVRISPSPGLYGGPIKVSFAQLSGSPKIHYRVQTGGDPGSYQLYTSAFQLTNDATIHYYATNATSRSRLFTAAYEFGRAGRAGRQKAVDISPGSTNPAPTFNTNTIVFADSGTVFFGRKRITGSKLEGLSPGKPYYSFADSPFNPTNAFDYFVLETFEDGSADMPGAAITPGWTIANPNFTTDSVDGDDGSIDDLGYMGHSLYSGGSQNSFTISFTASALGGRLPTHVGIAWTDVGTVSVGNYGVGDVQITARDANGVSLGSLTAPALGNGSSYGFGCSEDRFFAAVNRGGISSFTLTMPASTDWEIDHIQYGYLAPEAFDGSIWAISLDGSAETRITTGARPRVSPDGRWLAFLREGDAFSGKGNLWVREMATGYENRLVMNSQGEMNGFDWDTTGTNIVFDYNGSLWRVGLVTPPVQLPLPAATGQGAPAINPASGAIAYHTLPPGNVGLYLAPSDGSSAQKLSLGTLNPMWPAWSPDGGQLVFAVKSAPSPSLDDGKDLWVIRPDSTELAPITGFWNAGDGFPHGALFSPNSDALVGAGTIFGTNGLWLIELTGDGLDCDGPPLRLPTSPGDPIDFAGSIVAAAQPTSVVAPHLFIVLLEQGAVVYWSSAYRKFTLEYTSALAPSAVWTPISGPYAFDGYYFQHPESLAGMSQSKFFRLRYNPLQ